MPVSTMVILLILVLLLFGALPIYPYSRTWGPWPSGGIGFLLIVLIVLLALGRV